MSESRESWPVLVRAGLIGLETRGTAVGFARVTAAVAVACGLCGFEEEAFFGIAGLLGAVAGWNFLCIWWVDRHGRWSAHRAAIRRLGSQLLAGDPGQVLATDLHHSSHPQP